MEQCKTAANRQKASCQEDKNQQILRSEEGVRKFK